MRQPCSRGSAALAPGRMHWYQWAEYTPSFFALVTHRSVFSEDLLNTEMWNPFSATLRAKFCRNMGQSEVAAGGRPS